MIQTFSLATYLAVKEVLRNRGRFVLVGLVIALITLLVLFIAALGEGLGNGNRQYVANLDADLIVFLEKSDFIIAGSRLDDSTVRNVRRIDGVADAGAIYTSSSEIDAPVAEPLRISLLGVEAERPGSPAIVEGRLFRSAEAKETIIDQNVAIRTGIGVGDDITIRSTQGTKDQFFTLRVVGLTKGQSYFFQPTIFVSPQTWEQVRPKSAAELSVITPSPNVIAVRLVNRDALESMKQVLTSRVDRIEVADIPTTINNIPGYSAQQGTVQTQGVFTLLIGVLVIGGFFQIQILQKVPQIGVLKAIGASNAVVGASAVIQIIVVTAFGVAMGGLVTFLFSLFFPPTIPLQFNGNATALAVTALLLIGPLGGMVSIFYAVRIEPLKALRLS